MRNSDGGIFGRPDVMRMAVMISTLFAAIATIAWHSVTLTSRPHIDPDHQYAWGENMGWMNWRDADGGQAGVIVGSTNLSGFVWAENVGWINVGDGSPTDGVHYANKTGDDFGINIDPSTGGLFGLAWGENIGWINLDTASVGENRARFDKCAHRFLGYAWGENVGWFNLNDAVHFVAIGPCGFADFDCDGVVELEDYKAFESMLYGPTVMISCPAFDADPDGDIDLRDFAAFQSIFASHP